MKFAFIASHSQRDDLLSSYRRIHEALKKHTESEIFTGRLFDLSEDSLKSDQKSRADWYRAAVTGVKKADILVLEISYPSSANVGHLLTTALELGKPVLALYRMGRDPIFLSGSTNDKLILLPYTDDDIETVISSGIDYASEQQDTRFNFFVSPKHQHYLDYVSKSKKLPRAVFLRRLIEEEMENDEEYNKES